MPFVPDQPTQPRGFVPDKQTGGGFVGNLVKSGGQFLGDTANAIIHPGVTIKNVANSVGTTEGRKAIGNYYSQRYGGLDNAWNSFYNDPVGVIADASTVLGVAGVLLKGAGVISKASGLSKAGKIASTASKITDPLTIASKVVSTPINRAFRRVGSGMVSAGENLVTKGLNSDIRLEEAAARAGTTPGKFIEKYNLYQRTPQSAANASRSIWDNYYNSAVKSGKTLPVADIVSAIDTEIAKLSDLPAEAMSRNTLAQIAELQARKKGLLAIAGQSGELTPEQALRFRKELDADIPESAFGLGPKTKGRVSATKTARDVMKEKINSLSPETAQAGLDYGVSKQLQKTFRRYQSRTKNKQLVSFGGVTKAGLGGILGGVKGAIIGYATDAITNDPRFIKTASKTLGKTGKKLEGAKLPKAPAWTKKIYQVGKTGRMVNRPNSSKQ